MSRPRSVGTTRSQRPLGLPPAGTGIGVSCSVSRWWPMGGYLSVPALGITYREDDFRMKDFYCFALRPSPRIPVDTLKGPVEHKGSAHPGSRESIHWNNQFFILDFKLGLLLIHLEKLLSFFGVFNRSPQWATISIFYVGKCWFHQRHLLWSKEDEKEEASASLEITATAISGPQGQELRRRHFSKLKDEAAALAAKKSGCSL